LEVQSLQRKLKLSEEDLDKAEDSLAEANSRLKEAETEIEELRRSIAYFWFPVAICRVNIRNHNRTLHAFYVVF